MPIFDCRISTLSLSAMLSITHKMNLKRPGKHTKASRAYTGQTIERLPEFHRESSRAYMGGERRHKDQSWRASKIDFSERYIMKLSGCSMYRKSDSPRVCETGF